jgi:hypothetical protein
MTIFSLIFTQSWAGSAIGFLNFMGGYTVFLGPICSIMIVDVGGQGVVDTLVVDHSSLVLVRAQVQD